VTKDVDNNVRVDYLLYEQWKFIIDEKGYYVHEALFWSTKIEKYILL